VTTLSVHVGGLALKNPVIAAAGEHLQTASGIRAALDQGAAVVVAKSINETYAAKVQLEQAEYCLLDVDWRRQPWNFQPPVPAFMLNRSGLIDRALDDWADTLGQLDAHARQTQAYVAASIVLADLDAATHMAQRFAQAGIRLLEFNIGTPYGDEAAAVTTERHAARVQTLVRAMRTAIPHMALWVKLTSQSENVTALADAARQAGADAVVLIGRSLAMLPDLDTMRPVLGTNAAYGGRWALPLTCYWLARTRKTLGPDYPLIATNGARDGLDVARMLLAGASAVQMCSAVLAGGFAVLRHSVDTLHGYLDHNKVEAKSIIGRAADASVGFADLPASGHWRTCVPRETLEALR